MRWKTFEFIGYQTAIRNRGERRRLRERKIFLVSLVCTQPHMSSIAH